MNTVLNSTGHTLHIPEIVAAEGIYLHDQQGKRYMDLESGIWCTCLGHNHPRISRVMKNQIDRLMHAGFCYSNSVVEEAAGAVLDITQLHGGKCVFLCSGSEAIELARAADPSDTAALALAAELYRKTSRYGDAIDAYRELAKREKR